MLVMGWMKLRSAGVGQAMERPPENGNREFNFIVSDISLSHCDSVPFFQSRQVPQARLQEWLALVLEPRGHLTRFLENCIQVRASGAGHSQTRVVGISVHDRHSFVTTSSRFRMRLQVIV